MRSLAVPVLYIHGTADQVVPTVMSQRLYEATLNKKKLVIVRNAGHNTTAETNESLYRDSILSFFRL